MFASVVAGGYLTTRFMLNKSNSLGRRPEENAKVRFKTKEAMYRTRLLSSDAKTWVFAAPIQRNILVPISVGETLTCEVMVEGGVLLFTAKVIDRCNERGALIIAAPKNPVFVNRRSTEREVSPSMDAQIAGISATVMDLSPGGAKVRIKKNEKSGASVSVRLGAANRNAKVMDAENEGGCTVLRLQFDEPSRN
ncbi:MAG TPA: flagellar brake protein [Fimbriimonas sp.]|nr:flagellar brake protein [Fimbriimonas sp.]